MAISRLDHSEDATDERERRFSDDAADLAASIGSSVHLRSPSPVLDSFRSKLGFPKVARRTLGIGLLLVTVFLWTTSNFLASSIFSDHTYDKPFFLLYANSSVFAIYLIPMFTRYLMKNGLVGLRSDARQVWFEIRYGRPTYNALAADDDTAAAGERILVSDDGSAEPLGKPDEKLNFSETVRLSLEFCMLWFLANYFSSACLEYTSVASVTILNSLSSVWTLVFGAMFGVEPFSVRKLIGVLASLAGVVLISTVDLTGKGDEDSGSFPHKTTSQIAIGDGMAFLGAAIYGLYITVMKRRVGNEDKVDMTLFFGLVGFLNLVFLWPLFFILHWTDIEPFEFPPTTAIWMVIIFNSLASFVSDISWAFAMLLTTPLVVTVGLSLTIPLSLIGEMIQYAKYSSALYWIGALVVFVSFIFINNESREEAGEKEGAEPGHNSSP